MRRALALAFLCATVPVASAHADSLYSFTFTDTATQGGSLTFDLSTSTPYTTSSGQDFQYTDVPATVNGSSDTLTMLGFIPFTGSEIVSFTDGSSFNDTLEFGDEFLTGTPDGTAPTITAGTFTGQVVCSSTLRSPFASSSVAPTMAFLQMQFPVSYNCGDTVELVVAPDVAATPEPGSFALLATGLVGVCGVMRRRIWS